MLLIQIGLGMTQEYAYLVGGEIWPTSDSEFMLPDDIPLKADWTYIGVDMTPHYVETAKQACPQGTFLEFAVVEPDFPADEIKHQGWRLSDDGFPMSEGVWGWTGDWYITKTITLENFFHIYGKPDALVIDVENHELPILKDYPWSFHKPDYLKIEMHSRKSADILVPLIMSEGYSLLKFDPVNSYKNTNTSDAQFLRSDIAHKEKQRYEYGKED